MSFGIESLESRLFFSAASLSTDEATLHSDIAALGSAGSSWQSTLEGDVSRLTGKDKSLGEKWVKGDLSKYKALLKADTTGAAAVNKDVAKLDADEAALSANPTSAALEKKVSVDTAKLQAAATKAESALTTDSNGLLSANTHGPGPPSATPCRATRSCNRISRRSSRMPQPGLRRSKPISTPASP